MRNPSPSFRRLRPPALALAGWLCLSALAQSLLAQEQDVATQNAAKKVAITFTGGHETDKADGGRPVVLIAAALQVTPEVFRQAFDGVTPAKGGKPSPDRARANKSALLKVLKTYGVTNERLDEVSDYYRYQPQLGEIWKSTPAQAHAIIEEGQIKRIVVTSPGAGYTTPPTATIPGFETIALQATLHFGEELKQNGSVKQIDVADPKK